MKRPDTHGTDFEVDTEMNELSLLRARYDSLSHKSESLAPGRFKCRVVCVEATMATKQLDNMSEVSHIWGFVQPCKTMGGLEVRRPLLEKALALSEPRLVSAQQSPSSPW